MTSGIDPAANADAIVDAVGGAASGGAAMLFTPEMSVLLDRDRTRAADRICREDANPVLARILDAAAGAGIWVQLGSMAVTSETDGARLANRSLVIDDHGTIRARYDKLHLFDVDLADGQSWRESAGYRAGDETVVAATPLGPLGLSICYDVRFPELYAALSGAGATILSVPAAFTVPTGIAHWHVLLRARAIENAAFVVAAAQTGRHADGRETFGHSLVVNPWGEVFLDMGQRTGLGFCEIDLAQVAELRTRLPVIAHRRAIPEAVVFE